MPKVLYKEPNTKERREKMAKTIPNGIDNLPPPPPPPTSKNPHKTLIVTLLIVLVIVSAAILAYLAIGKPGTLSTNDNTNTSPSPSGTLPTNTLSTRTPSPTSSLSTAPPSTLTTTTPPGSASPTTQPTNIEKAQSLQFTVTYTTVGMAGQEMYTYTFSMKNIGSANMMMRIEGRFFETQAFFNKTYILNEAPQKAWVYELGQWTDVSDQFSVQWTTWNNTWQGYREKLLAWNGLDDLYYNVPSGDIVHIYDVLVNPDLTTSLFQH